MPSKTWLLLLLLIMLATVGCTANAQVIATPTPAPTATAPATEVPVAPTEIVLPSLGEPQTVAFNGFTFRPVEGWSLSTEGNSVSMEAPDALVTAGPGIFITGGYLEDFGVNVEGPVAASQPIIEAYLASFIPMETSVVTPFRKIAVNRVAGNDMDFIVPEENPPYRGRITVLQNGRQVFLMLGLTPPERWEDEFKPLYEEVLRATTMVEIERE